VKLGVLLLAKFNLLQFEILRKASYHFFAFISISIKSETIPFKNPRFALAPPQTCVITVISLSYQGVTTVGFKTVNVVYFNCE